MTFCLSQYNLQLLTLYLALAYTVFFKKSSPSSIKIQQRIKSGSTRTSCNQIPLHFKFQIQVSIT